MRSDIFEVPHEFITHSIRMGIKAHRENKPFPNNGSDCKNIYFAGRTLCLDIKDKNGDEDVITITHTNEDYGYFSGGMRRMLPINTVKELETLMEVVGIEFEPKNW